MSMYAVVADFSHMWHQCYHAAYAAGPQYDLFLTTIRNLEGKLRTTERALEKLRIVGYDLVFAEDRPATRKTDLWPGYKGTRENRAADKDQAKQYLLEHGYKGKFCWSEDNEADDVIATLVRLANQTPGLMTVIVTSDKDLWQLISERTVVFNPITKLMVTPDDIQKAFGLNKPKLIPIHKALWGDAGDCVPNAVPRMQKHLMPVLESLNTGSLEEFQSVIKSQWHTLSDRCKELYREGEGQAALNYELVKLDSQCKLSWC